MTYIYIYICLFFCIWDKKPSLENVALDFPNYGPSVFSNKMANPDFGVSFVWDQGASGSIALLPIGYEFDRS